MGMLKVDGPTRRVLNLSKSVPLYTPFTDLLSVVPPPDLVELSPLPPQAVIKNAIRNNVTSVLATVF